MDSVAANLLLPIRPSKAFTEFTPLPGRLTKVCDPSWFLERFGVPETLSIYRYQTDDIKLPHSWLRAVRCIGVSVDGTGVEVDSWSAGAWARVVMSNGHERTDVLTLRLLELRVDHEEVTVCGWYPISDIPSEDILGIEVHHTQAAFNKAMKAAWQAMTILRDSSSRGRPPRITDRVVILEENRRLKMRNGDKAPSQEELAFELGVDRWTLVRTMDRLGLAWPLD